MNELDKWVSDNLKLKLLFEGFEYNFKYFPYTWTLSDARCREIVRECFWMDTEYNRRSGGYCIGAPDFLDEAISGVGKTIAEAEIACIAAIKEAEG